MIETTASLVIACLQATIVGVMAIVIYALFRRFAGPRFGVSVASIGVLCMAIVTLFAFSPWPNWTELSNALPSQTSNRETANVSPKAVSANAKSISKQPPAWDWQTFATEFSRTLHANEQQQNAVRDTTQVSARVPWKSSLLIVVVVSLIYGTTRFVIGLISTHRLRVQSRQLNNRRVSELGDQIQAAICCTAKLHYYESSRCQTAATMGVVRPIVLLPADWKNWTDHQLKTVLSHEIAHIHHRDFWTLVCTQVALAVQYFHPVAHWLSSRVKLDQEIAADASAAKISGGRERYLHTLAQMALSQENQRTSWATQAFLPTRRSFLRRIEVLRSPHHFAIARLQRLKPVVCSALVLSTIFVMGFRLPSTGISSNLAAQEPKPNANVAEAHSLEFVPRDAAFALFLRPQELLMKPEFKEIAELLGDAKHGMKAQIGIHPNRITRLVILDVLGEGPDSIPFPQNKQGFILHTATENDAMSLAKAILPNSQTRSFAGLEYQADGKAVYRNKNLVIFSGHESTVKKLLLAGPEGAKRSDWAKPLDRYMNHTLAVGVNLTWGKDVYRAFTKRVQTSPFAGLTPLLTESETIAGGIRSDMQVEVSIETKGQDSAKTVVDTLTASRILAQNMLNVMKTQLAQQDQPDSKPAAEFADLVSRLLQKVSIETQENSVQVTLDESHISSEVLVKTIAPAVMAARAAAVRTQDMYKFRQIALGLLNYESAHGHFPAAVNVGPDGKTVHSWRVAILPYLEEPGLYERYRLNEPWDSPHNKKILAQMPDIYKSAAGGNPSETFMQVFDGQACVFHGMNIPTSKDIADGNSKTILCAESTVGVPWTKPADMKFDPTKKIKLGGRHTGGGFIATADGAVRFASHQIDQNVLRALITCNGAEEIPDF